MTATEQRVIKELPASSHDNGFYQRRDFNRVGAPLLWTEERSKLTPITWDGVVGLLGDYFISIKKDGKFIRVIKRGNLIRMLTSGYLDFYHNSLAAAMRDFPDGQYNMEMIYEDGLLKSRDHTGYLTTACTEYRKGIAQAGDWSGQDALSFEVHDYLYPLEVGGYALEMPYGVRRFRLQETFRNCVPHSLAVPPLISHTPSLWLYLTDGMTAAQIQDQLAAELGYDPSVHEGLVFHNASETYRLPINPWNFKLKNVRELVGVVIQVEQDKNGGNGTLVLDVVDAPKGAEYCRVSSGMNNSLRALPTKDLIGVRVEVEYESLTDAGEYNQPRIKRFDI